MSTNELPDGLQQTGVNSPFNACMYRDDCRSEHAQRLTLQHHACDLAQRVADLERLNGMHKAAWLAYQPLGDYMQALSMARKLPVGTLGRHLGDVAIERMQAQEARIAELEAERDEWKRIASAYSTQKELSTALEQAKASGRQARKERDDLRAWKDAVEAREPAIVEAGELRVGFGDTEEAVWLKLSRNIPLGTELFTHPAPAQAVPESVAGLVSVFCYDEVLTFTFCDEAAADNFAGRFDPSVDSAAAPEHKA